MKIKYGILFDVSESSTLKGGDNSWLGAAINATVNTAGIITNAIQAKRQRQANIALQRETNAQNLALAREQNSWSERMIKEQNSYNSPENQRKLLEDAGYNPVLFSPDGMTQNTIPSSANLANQVAPSYHQDMTGFNQALSSLSNSGLTYLESLKLTKEIDKTAAETPKIIEETNKIKSEIKVNEETARQIAVDIDKSNVLIDNLRESKKAITQSILESKSRTDLNYAKTREIFNNVVISRKQIELQEKLTEANINRIFSEIGLNQHKIKEISQHIVKMGRETVQIGRQIKLADIQYEYQTIINDYLPKEKESELDKYQADIYKSLTGELNRTVNTFVGDLSSDFRTLFYNYNSGTSAQYQKGLQDKIYNKHGLFNPINFNKQY